MNNNIIKLASCIEEIKLKIKDAEYKKIMDYLKELHDDSIYKLTYFEGKKNIELTNNMTIHFDISYKKREEFIKLDTSFFTDIESLKNSFIINDCGCIDNSYYLETKSNDSYRYLTKKYFKQNINDDDNITLSYSKILPIHVE